MLVKHDSVLLFSGGLDSLIAWYYLKNPLCVYVDLGHRYNNAEMSAVNAIKKLTSMQVVMDNRLHMGDLEHPDAHIPLRNAFLGLIGSIYGDAVWLVVQEGERALPDRSEDFFMGMTSLVKILKGDDGAQLSSPFFNLTKTDMVRWYISQKLPVDVLLATSSCYVGTRCGECPACFRRWVSLCINGLKDFFQVNPWESETAKIYVDRCKQGIYSGRRSAEIYAALDLRKWIYE